MASKSPPGHGDEDVAPTLGTNPNALSFSELPRREMAVRLCLPGLDAPEHRLEMDPAFPLTNTLIDVLSQAPHVKELEFLTLSGDRQVEYFLTPRLSSATEKSLQVPIQTAFSDFASRQTSVPETTPDKVASLAAKTLPEAIGIEICDVDLASIRMWPVTTGRVLLKTNGALRQSHFDWNDPYVETVRRLAGTGHPFVVQLIIGTGTRGGHVVTLRYAIIHPEYALASEHDKAEHVLNGRQYPVEMVWHNAGLKTNYDLPIQEFISVIESLYIYSDTHMIQHLPRRPYMSHSDSVEALDLFTGATEYRALFQGRPSTSTLYEKLDLHGRIPVNEYTLRLFGSLVPLYYETSPWDHIPRRVGPVITTRAVFRSAPGTEQSHGHATESAADRHDSGFTVTAGSEGHEQLLAFAVEYFEGQGDEAWVESQDGRSLADGGRRTADGTRREIEVEIAGLSKPANPLINYARATSNDRPVDFVLTSQSKATRLYESLRTPWKELTDYGTHLHNMTSTVELSTGQVPVVPAKGTESNWYLDTDGELTLRDTAGDVLASGPADEPTGSFEYETPRYDDSDRSHRVVTPEGVTEATYESRGQLLDDWTLIHAPFVPAALYYLSNVRVHYQSGDGLVELDTQANWDRTAETATQRFQAGLREFVETYTCEQPGASMSYASFQEHAQAFFAVRSRHDPPNKTHIGRALPDELDVDGPNRSERQVHDRSLIYPPGLVSPDLPFVDEGSDSDETDTESDR